MFGYVVVVLGGGWLYKGDCIDLCVGFVSLLWIGDEVGFDCFLGMVYVVSEG